MTAGGKTVSQIDPKKYAQFIAQLEIADVALLSSRVENSSYGEPPTDMEIAVKPKKSWYINKANEFNVFQSYEVRVVERATKRQAAKLSVAFALTYRSLTPMTDSIFNIFSDLNLRVNTWPYLREFIHTSVGRMNWPPLVLPTFKVGTEGAKRPRQPSLRKRISTKKKSGGANVETAET